MNFPNKIRQKGQSQVEYALILALVSLVGITTLVLLGPKVGDVYSQIMNWSGTEAEENPGHVVVRVVDAEFVGIEGVRVYGFNERGHYLGRQGKTDENGEIAFKELDEGRYKFLAYHRGHRYWSEVIQWQGEWLAIVETGERPFTVTVIDAANEGIHNVRVYAFTADGGYTGVYGNTDEFGELILPIPDGDFKFRADFRGHQYWSDPVTTPGTITAVVETGERPFAVHVVNADGAGLNNVRVYAFTNEDRYTGVYGNTGEDGIIELDIPDGNFKFRADYRAHQYWSDGVETPSQESATIQTKEQEIAVSVIDSDGNGLNNVRVYAFSADDRYTGIYGNSGEDGIVQLNLPAGNFKFRADYRGHQYWSDTIETPQQDSATIQTKEQEIGVTVTDSDGNGISNVRVYAFTQEDSYTGTYGNTDDSGVVQLDLPEGNFKFRADYRGHQYWSSVIRTPGQNTAVIQTNEQEIAVSVVDGNGNGISNVRVYAFTQDDRYTGTYGNTDDSGVVQLKLPAGNFKFRADYRTQQFWSGDIAAPGNSSVSIETGEAISTVQILNEARQPVANVVVYAFNEQGNYTGVYGRTDNAGQVNLALPRGSYKFRADYRGQQTWSSTISSPENLTITITTQ